jgi:FixJ family two-component response regulator
MKSPTTLIIEDDPVTRALLHGWLRGADMPAQMFDSGEAFLHHFNVPVSDSRPVELCDGLPVNPFPQAGCLLVDITLPGMDGLQLQKRLATQRLHLPMVFLTGSATISMAVAAIKRGAVDFLEKTGKNSEQVLAAVREALAIDARFRRQHRRHKTTRRRLATLTARELEVMESLVAKREIKQIASASGRSYATVRNQRRAILRKMKVSSTVELYEAVQSMRRGYSPTFIREDTS